MIPSCKKPTDIIASRVPRLNKAKPRSIQRSKWPRRRCPTAGRGQCPTSRSVRARHRVVRQRTRNKCAVDPARETSDTKPFSLAVTPARGFRLANVRAKFTNSAEPSTPPRGGARSPRRAIFARGHNRHFSRADCYFAVTTTRVRSRSTSCPAWTEWRPVPATGGGRARARANAPAPGANRRSEAGCPPQTAFTYARAINCRYASGDIPRSRWNIRRKCPTEA